MTLPRRLFLARLSHFATVVAAGCSGTSRGDATIGGPSNLPDAGRVDTRSEAGLPEAGEGLAEAGPQCAATTDDVQGPFYESGAPERGQLAGPEEPGERIVITGRVVDLRCQPVGGALLDVWQADAEGSYHGAEQEYRLRGQLRTNAAGEYRIGTIRPGNYALGDGFRPAHIHFTVSHPRHVSLTTQLYFQDDPFLPPHDACGSGCNSTDPARVVALSGTPATGEWTIVLAPR